MITEQWTSICTVEELASNLGVCALIDGQQVAVFRVGQNYFALDNFDPFSKANVIRQGHCRGSSGAEGGSLSGL